MPDDLGLLSERELEVLQLVATGVTNQEIARALVISPNTVKVHLRNIYEKLGVQSRTEATMEAVRRGWVSVPGVEPAEGGQPVQIAAPTEEAVLAAASLLAAQPAAEALPDVPPRPPIAAWQRAYMIAAALLVILASLAPGWWRSRSPALLAVALTDVGQAQTAAAPRSQALRWQPRARLPQPVSRFALVSDGARLYAIAGETAAGVSDQTAVYDPDADRWQIAAAKPTAVANVSAAWLAGRIYLPGGTLKDGLATDILEVYDPQTDRWSAAAAAPAPRAAYGLAALNGKLYLFGGADSKSYRAETYVYDPVADRWESAARMPSPRAFLAAAVIEGKVYVAGGFDGQRELDTVAVYDPGGAGQPGGAWSTAARLNAPRGGLGLVALGPRLYAVGGGWTTPLDFSEQYDAQTGVWSRSAAPIIGQWRNLGAAAVGQKVYAMGGWSGGYLVVNEEYQPLFRTLLPLGSKGG